ncbi:hypothetical protein [uncultured Methanobrevibacter sp.]|uniref:hypothetical protein n=1 Tax=uncultured Methanobrevibacter sp. TaxID=253161 RepID=UPI0026149C48|nr:hypothetical protein [uncultured Methanobrevibacter sp.]
MLKRRKQMKIEDIERFYLDKDADGDVIIKDRENDLVMIASLRDALYMLNKLVEENDLLKHHIFFNQKNDDGGFHVWEVPPIKRGQRITINTYGSEPK